MDVGWVLLVGVAVALGTTGAIVLGLSATVVDGFGVLLLIAADVGVVGVAVLATTVGVVVVVVIDVGLLVGVEGAVVVVVVGDDVADDDGTVVLTCMGVNGFDAVVGDRDDDDVVDVVDVVDDFNRVGILITVGD